jgi:hypothetical protein
VADAVNEPAAGADGDVLAVHRNPTSWYNNASFALPLLATLVVGLAGLVLRRSDVLAFAGFLAAVTACMAPVVLVSWRHTPTAIVLTRAAITSLHGERVLKTLPWTEVASVTRRETQGNVRWIVAAREGERIALDGELEDLPGLIAAIERLANVT